MNLLNTESSFVNRIILPGSGRKYSGKNSKGLVWLRNKLGQYYPNHFLRKPSKSVLLYAHGNGGSLGDFKSIVTFYAAWFNMSVFAIEYPGYGPAEGEPGEVSVNDNYVTAFEFLLELGYPRENIVLMGYSIGTGPVLKLAASLCEAGTPPGAVVTVAAFLSVCDIARDLQGSMFISFFADAIANRWNSGEIVSYITCPILFIHGQTDEVIPWEHSQKLHDLCGSENKFLRICPEANHTHFEEPADTVDPTASFLRSYFCPCNRNVILAQIPAFRYICPQSVLDRETRAANGGTLWQMEDLSSESGMSVERTCFNMADLLVHTTSWLAASGQLLVSSVANIQGNGVITTGTARTTERYDVPVEVENDGGSDIDDGENGSNNGAKMLSGGDGSNNYNNRGNINVATSSNHSNNITPRRNLADIDEGDNGTFKSLGSSNSLHSRDSREDREMESLLLDARLTLHRYYDALNQRNVPAAVAHLHPEVSVRFPEEERNWSGCDTAVSKFQYMFSTLPGFLGSVEILECSVLPDTGDVVLVAACQFSCHITRYKNSREMVYTMRDGKIYRIEHKALV